MKLLGLASLLILLPVTSSFALEEKVGDVKMHNDQWFKRSEVYPKMISLRHEIEIDGVKINQIRFPTTIDDVNRNPKAPAVLGQYKRVNGKGYFVPLLKKPVSVGDYNVMSIDLGETKLKVGPALISEVGKDLWRLLSSYDISPNYPTLKQNMTNLSPKAVKIPSDVMSESLSSSVNGMVKSLGFIGTLSVFLPSCNLYADTVGYSCSDAKKNKNIIHCEKDSLLNPLNHVINCSEIIQSWIIGKNNSGEEVCAVKSRKYSFRLDSDKGNSYLASSGLISKSGVKVNQSIGHDVFVKDLKSALGVKVIDEAQTVYPENLKEMN